ncbi:hypothetical protein RNZ50_06585 [Paracoccaceae bacterium Fryx2]|nr:hypothetical protein [Paracoccaceae bacterium Fryx2]
MAGWAAAGKLRITTGICMVRCGDTVIAGQVTISPMEVLPLFRRCGTGPAVGTVRRIMAHGSTEWQIITDPAAGIPVAVADMLILAEDFHAFEEEYGIARRVPAGPGATSPYDWDGMIVALVVRIVDHGLPTTQAELVAEMQEWFADQSGGKKMPDSRSIRRRITPIWRALRREDA